VSVPHRPLRLTLDGDALVQNWRWLDRMSGSAAAGAAVKADGYGLGATEVVRRLGAAGCRDFFVATCAGGILDGLVIDTLMSHLACADEDVDANERQRRAFADLAARLPARRRSLANSAGICLGSGYHFDLTRPGLALYGGIPRAEAAGHIRPVARLEAQIVQRRTLLAGDAIGYNATFRAERDMAIAILNLGYADGYLRGFSDTGRARLHGDSLPVIGRVSMDLTAIGVDAAPQLGEGAWLEIDFDLPSASAQSGLSQYELLTTLGLRHERRWL
jgi:alanine racemase